MADTKISDLPSGTPAVADIFPIVQGGVTKKATLQGVVDLVGPAAPTGACNDVNTVFTFTRAIKALFLSGQLMKKDVDYTLSVSDTVATMAAAPSSNDWILCF